MWQHKCSNTLRSCMAKSSKQDLVRAAAQARQRAVAPYSKFKVGAALLTRAGEIITGANVESASYGLTCCAERVALFNALTGGKGISWPSPSSRAPRAGRCPAAPAANCSPSMRPRPRSGWPTAARCAPSRNFPSASCYPALLSMCREIRIEKRLRGCNLLIGSFCR